GDTTNTASRLESMTKESDHDLFISDSTRDALVTASGDLVEVGEFEVRGRSESIKVWSVRID
ncbi:MAG: adenylate/guanylate cyclase domain-containing protein, partial [bacterium]